MPATFNRHLRHLVALAVSSSGLLLAPAAQGDATDERNSCFNFLEAQDYIRAEQTAKNLTRRKGLTRTEQRSAWLCLGRAYRATGRNKDALVALQKVETLSLTIKELAVAYNWLGLVYGGLGDLDRAELYGQRELKANRETGDKSDEAGTLNNLAGIAKARGDTDRALAMYEEALALEPDAVRKPATLNNIALIHAGRSDYPKAAEMLRQAIAISHRSGDAHGAAQRQINLGYVLTEAKQYADAEKELLAGLSTIRLLGDKDWEALACENFGDVARAAGSKPQGMGAAEWYQKALSISREMGDTQRASRVVNKLSNVK